MNGSGQPDTGARIKVLYFLWAAFALAVVIYGVVAFILNQPGGAAQDPLYGTLRHVLGVVALAIAGFSFWWRKLLATSTRSPLCLFAGAPGELPSPEAQAAALGRLQTNCIIVWTLSESIALFGLLLTFLTRSFGEFIPFGCGSLILLFGHRPGAWPLDRVLGRESVVP